MEVVNKQLRIGIVAGEPSGDLLGAKLISSLKELNPNIEFVGIAGPLMQEAGCTSIDNMDTLSVNGLVEVLGSIYSISQLKQKLVKYFTDNPPDAFIGIDAPDFNIGLEKTLKARGIKTIHFVSPTIWAWRPKRVHTIKKAVDLMLNIFPFEKTIYDEHGIASEFVGHPLTWEFQHEPMPEDSSAPPLVLLMPGSRTSEIKKLAPTFLQAAMECYQQRPELTFALPAVNETIFLTLKNLIKAHFQSLPISLSMGHSQNLMKVADVILMASGTATMEGLIHRKPMVVAYKLSPISYWLGKRLVQVDYAAMPNILAKQMLIPEFLQEKAQPKQLADAILAQLDKDFAQSDEMKAYEQIIESLYRPADTAAKVVLKFIEGHY